jgi:3-aminobutyryl-CoA ammonia-lyase
MKTTLKLRLSQQDAHYGGNLVDGARALALFGDAATELLIRHDGDEGLFRSYDQVDFLAPLYAGDFVEVRAQITQVGNSSRKMHFECWKVIAPRPDISASAADVLAEPVLCVWATGTCIVKAAQQRVKHG